MASNTNLELLLEHHISADCTNLLQTTLQCTFTVLANSKGIIMEKSNFFTDMQNKINQAIENSPAKDIEKNVKAMMAQGFSKLDLVTREEFDVQAQVLAKTRARLEALEAQVAALEAQGPK